MVLETIVHFLALASIALTLAAIARSAAGIIRFLACDRKLALLGRRCTARRDALHHCGISLVAAGRRTPAQVAALLSIDYAPYEVLLVTDFHDDPYHNEILATYAMMRTDYVSTGELSCHGIRGVYRSRQKRYRRLIVIDHAFTSQSNALNCGSNLSLYDYLIPLDRWTQPCPDALLKLMIELQENAPRRNLAICAYKTTSMTEMPMQTLDTAVRMMLFGTWQGKRGWSMRQNELLVLFARESMIEAGGFADDDYPEAELLRRIRIPASGRGTVRFTPQVLAKSQLERPDTFPKTLFFHAVRIVVLLLAGLLAAGFAACWRLGYVDGMKSMLLSLLALLLGCCCVAALSLAVVEKTAPCRMRNSLSPHLIFSVFLYPFYLLEYFISPGNFAKS